MDPVAIFGVLAGLVALATVLGLLWRATNGRVRPGQARDVVAHREVPLGRRATLLQFSTEVCAPCVPTHAMLGALAREHTGVRHVDLNITGRAELAAKFRILQTPTTFILDRRGVVRARIGGAPRPAELRAELARVLAV